MLLPTRPTERPRTHFLLPEALVYPHPTPPRPGREQRGTQEDQARKPKPYTTDSKNCLSKIYVRANRRYPTTPGGLAFESRLPFLGSGGAPAAADPKLSSTASSSETITCPGRVPATPGWRLLSFPVPRRVTRPGYTDPSLGARSSPKNPKSRSL